MRPWILLAGLNGALAIGFAAYGAHGVDAAVAPLMERASNSQLIHAVVLLAVDRLVGEGRRGAVLAGALIAAGIVMFSGSLYAKTLAGPLPVPLVTPAGGISLILGWIALMAAAIDRHGPPAV